MFDLHDLFPVDLYCRRAGQRGDRHGIAHRGDGPAWPADAAAGRSGAAGPSLAAHQSLAVTGRPGAGADCTPSLVYDDRDYYWHVGPDHSLLIGLNPRWSALALGAALIVYAGYALCSPVFQVSGRVEKWLSPLMGGLTGVITGATGVFVIPAVPRLQALGFRRDELVQATGLSFTLSTGVGGRPRPARWLA